MILEKRHISGTLTVAILAFMLMSGTLSGCQKDFTYKRPTLDIQVRIRLTDNWAD